MKPDLRGAGEPGAPSSAAASFDWAEKAGETYDGAAVHAVLWRPAPDLFVSRVVGRADLGCVSFYVTRAQSAILAGHRIAVFHDWSELTDYERAARDRLRTFGAQNDAAFRGVHFLVRSKIVAMAISAAAVAFRRRLYVYSDRASFLQRLDQALGRAR